MISCEDVGHILMVDISLFFSSVGLRVGRDPRIASNDNVHVRVFNRVRRGLSRMYLQIFQELSFTRSGSVGPNSRKIIGHDPVERPEVRGALGVEPFVFDLLDSGRVSLIARRCSG